MIDENNIIKQIKDFQKSFEIRNSNSEYMKGFSEALSAVKEMIADEVKVELTSQDIKELEQEIKCSGMALQSQRFLIKLLTKKMEYGWIPVNPDDEDSFPKTDSYIFLSFSNCSLPEIGRYEKSEDGGAFYIGDEDKSCTAIGLFVNAWQPMIPNYREEAEE